MSRSFCSVRGSRWSLGGVTWPTAETMPWNCGVFTQKQSHLGEPRPSWRLRMGGCVLEGHLQKPLGISIVIQPLPPAPSEPWRGKWVKERAAKITKTWSICLRSHPKDQVLLFEVVFPDWVKVALQLLPLPPIPEVPGPRGAKPSSPLAMGWKKHFCSSRGLGSSIQEWQSLHPMLRAPTAPRAPLLAPRCLQWILHFQPGAPAPSNALSACENVHPQGQRGANKFFGARNVTRVYKCEHKVLISPMEKRATMVLAPDEKSIFT